MPRRVIIAPLRRSAGIFFNTREVLGIPFWERWYSSTITRVLFLIPMSLGESHCAMGGEPRALPINKPRHAEEGQAQRVGKGYTLHAPTWASAAV